jgi:D-3-phosphoglycerate dehydrogenase
MRRLARDADGVIIRSKLPEDIFDVAPRVRAVCIHGTGTDLVPLESASAHGVMVANLPGLNAQSVAEYCAMAMLMLARNILTITAGIRTLPWDTARGLGASAHEIASMTLGIVGVGAIGDELLSSSDFVVLACPLNAQTRYLVNHESIRKMKRSAWLINIGRGPVVQEEALIAALREKRIAGAMLDVYEHYRLEPGHPLFSLDNIILTPHLAAVTQEYRARAGIAVADEMQRMLRGERPRNLVNPEVLEKHESHS